MDSQRPWLERLVASFVGVRTFPANTLLNINLPARAGDEIRGIRVTTLGSRVFSESLMDTSDPWGRRMYWIGGGQIAWSGREDSDFIAVREGYISVTPLHVDLTNYGLLEVVRGWRLGE